MDYRRVLVEWPARAFDLWWTLYRAALVIAVMAIVSVTVLALVLEFGFGIRFGW